MTTQTAKFRRLSWKEDGAKQYEAKLGDRIVWLSMAGSTREGTVISVTQRTVLAEFPKTQYDEAATVPLPKVFNSFGHVKRFNQYFLEVQA